jgi:hypothetical protein
VSAEADALLFDVDPQLGGEPPNLAAAIDVCE